jgi:hypothetical protein
MQINIEINTAGMNAMDGEFLVRLGQAFVDARAAGLAAQSAVSADPQPAAAKATRQSRGVSVEVAEAREIPGVKTTEPAPEVAVASGVNSSVTSATAPATASAASTPAAVAETEAPVSEADIIAAANAAVATIGAAGPAKIKTYIGTTYTKPDGTPGTIKLTRPEQRGALLADLQKIARGELVLP